MTPSIDRKRFFTLYNEGRTFNEIAEEMGVPAYAVCRYARKFGILPRPIAKAKRLPKREKLRVGDWVYADMPAAFAGAAEECGFATVAAQIVRVYPRYYLAKVKTPRGYLTVCQLKADAHRAAIEGDVRP